MSATAARAETETISFAKGKLEWRGVRRESEERNVVALRLKTDRGEIIGRYHPVTENSAARELAVVWVGGAAAASMVRHAGCIRKPASVCRLPVLRGCDCIIASRTSW